MRHITLAVALALLSGCAASQSVSHVARIGDRLPHQVEGRVEQVFDRYDIPVSERRRDSRVHSGSFTVGPWWAGASLEERIDCGVDERGEPRVRRRREVGLQVTVELRGEAVPDTTAAGLPGGAGGQTRNATRLTLTSTGRANARGNETRGPECELRAEFVEELLREMGGVPSPG